MKSTVLIQRELLGGSVSQNNQTEMFSATDLVRVGNMWRMANGLQGLVMSRVKDEETLKKLGRAPRYC